MGYLKTYLGDDPSGGVARTVTDYVATASQTTFLASYTIGLVDVYQNGAKLGIADYTASNGLSIVLATGATVGDLIEIVVYAPVSITSNITSDTFNGNGSTTVFTMNATPVTANAVLVVISGVTQDPSTYSVSGTTLTFSAAPPSGTGNISTRYLGIPSTGLLSSFGGGTTGLTPASATTGAVVLAGTLNVANGGTGATSATAYAVQCGGTTSTGAHQSVASVGTTGQVLTSNGAGALPTFQAASAFDAGTLMLFQQTAAPTGWTKATTHNNKALRVVSGSASSGGTVAFTTAFASQAVSGSIGTSGAYTLATADIPSHLHGNSIAGAFGGTAAFTTGVSPGNNLNTQSTGGGGSHSHSGGTFTGTAIDLAVQYVDLIIASKN